MSLAYRTSKDEVLDFINNNAIVENWLKRYVNGRGRLDRARQLYRFFKWLRNVKQIDLSPKALLMQQKQFRQSIDIEQNLWLFHLVMEYTRDNPDFKDYKDSTKLFLISIIRSFCNHYEVDLTTNTGGLGLKYRRGVNNRKQISLPDAKQFLGQLPQRERTICLLQLQSGMEISAVLEKFSYMWFSQVKPQLEADCERLKIEFAGRKGNNFSYFTYISTDAIQELRKWLRIRQTIIDNLLAKGRDLTPRVVEGEPIFITWQGTPYTAGRFVERFARIRRNRKSKRVTSHMFRKLFKTEASVPERGIDRNVIEFFMGHINGVGAMGGEYDRTPELHERMIEREYQKIEPYLNIYTGVGVTEATQLNQFNKLLHTMLQDEGTQQKFLDFLHAL